MKKSFLSLLMLIAALILSAQNHWYVDSIPMRDGKKLAADIYLPDTTGGQTYPVILIQTPYNRIYYRIALPMGFGTNMDNSPYAFVVVDWRCFYGSVSACTAPMDRGKDGYDVVEWIATQSWANGKTGTWGPSALGRIQYQTAREHPPHLTCAVPLVAGPQQNYEEYYPGGVLRKEYLETLDALGYGLSPTILAHQAYDIFWQYSENQTFYPGQIEIPLLMIGGWYDHNVNVMHDFFKGLKLSAPLSVRDKHKLLFGPWAHGGFSTAQVGTGQQGQLFYPGAAGWSDSLARLFFAHYLLDATNGWDTVSDYLYFQMGENVWQSASAFPRTEATPVSFYLHGDMRMTNILPTGTTDYFSLVYDPADPSPTIGGPTLSQNLGQGPFDQAPLVESRNDIGVYSTHVLTSPVVLSGKPVVNLYVSSDVLDTDFNVRLTDVYPDGRSMLLNYGGQRMRFRDGFWAADTAMMSPDSIYAISIELPYLAHTFLSGHRIRLDVSSANYPYNALNLNNGGAMYVAGDTIIAHNKLFTNSFYPSQLVLPLCGYTAGVTQEPVSDNNLWQIWPNPASDVVNITYSGEEAYFRFRAELMSSNGTVIDTGYSDSIEGISFNTGHLEPGAHFIKISDALGRVFTIKFISL